MAALAQALEELVTANRILARVHSLSQKSIASEAELTRTQTRVSVLSAQLQQAHSQAESDEHRRGFEVVDQQELRSSEGVSIGPRTGRVDPLCPSEQRVPAGDHLRGARSTIRPRGRRAGEGHRHSQHATMRQWES